MPIVFAQLVGFVLGAALAWVAAPDLALNEGPIVASRPFAVVVAFAIFVWLPVVGYFAAFHGDWSYLYVVASRRVPSAVDLGLVLLAVAAVVGGFWLAVGPVRRRRFCLLVALMALPGGIATAALPFVARRLAVSATYSQFHGDFGTEPIGASTLGKGVLLMGILLAAAIAWTVRALMRMGYDARG
jgi:hypothetical protein